MEMAYDPIKHTEIEVGKINIFKCQRAPNLPNAKKTDKNSNECKQKQI